MKMEPDGKVPSFSRPLLIESALLNNQKVLCFQVLEEESIKKKSSPRGARA